jgi:cytosine/adenosine deaminase-related metal-dependent hydrolase
VLDERIVIDGATIATVDASEREIGSGHVVVEGRRIVAVGPGRAPSYADDVPTRGVDGSGRLVTPGLVSAHHHFYQWITRGLVQEGTLFEWLVGLYPTWARIDEEMVYAAALGSVTSLLRSGCTTAMDHHYVFPHGAGDLLEAEIRAAAELGLRFHPTRGSMDLGQSNGGLPPDFAVEGIDAILAASEAAITKHHDPAPESMVRVAIAPCSPFSVSTDLLRESAVLARSLGVRLHTHGSETVEEEQFCHDRFGRGPTDYLESVGWLGEDVWMAHCVHMSDSDLAKFAATGTGVAHCPSSNARLGTGIARLPEMIAADVPVGLGVDGTASNESGSLGTELRSALLFARARRGPTALTARQALRVATMGGARVLGRETEIGSLEVGKLADLAVWDVDTAEHASMEDKVAALVMGGLPPLSLLLVNGRAVVEGQRVTTVDEDRVARETRTQARRLATIATDAG